MGLFSISLMTRVEIMLQLLYVWASFLFSTSTIWLVSITNDFIIRNWTFANAASFFSCATLVWYSSNWASVRQLMSLTNNTTCLLTSVNGLSSRATVT